MFSESSDKRSNSGIGFPYISLMTTNDKSRVAQYFEQLL